MASHDSKSQYAAAAHVPLIQSPSLRVPKPVELPPDIHPLPDNVNAYFVYPFTLEPHVLTLETSRRQTLSSHAARRTNYLHLREEDKMRRQREREEAEQKRKMEALRKIAPGFEPSGGPLVPSPKGKDGRGGEGGGGQGEGGTRVKDVMEDLVDRLAAMDS
ncbi:uncharacterized protein STEHIDRAFT_103444 [Stereum hirsutum FP-91666 SS1]|uniref:uncharacterized protein n=1 Tax=Stereum hirsutum (strain FP-91666) TaxID=721885 RepID=UPI00044493B2|nr:uncharacterized protein STEHIDRAFT_103444 [Stereum hirsutum FP-91666 SS1]EIM81971.1 hypothetical protein STEHIDRAFT_103444 [Stereum hirsutum FP-91666 SS1]